MAIVEVHWEPYYSYKPYGDFWEKNNPQVDEPTKYLLDLLQRHEVKAIFYVVGWLRYCSPMLFTKIVNEGHVIGDHTWYHDINDGQPRFKPFRAPRWKGQKRLYSGGFWFRFMPFWWIKKEVEKTGIFFIHPYDVMEDHPKCGNPFRNWMRQYGLKTSRDKLERLMREVSWDEPRGTDK